MLTIGVWLQENYSPNEGGGYSYYQKLIKSIDDYIFKQELKVVFISTTPINGLKKQIINIGKINWLSQSIKKGIEKLPFSKSNNLLVRVFKRKINILKDNNIDVLYYPIQVKQIIPDFPFVMTTWDIAHLSTYAFPEIASNGGFYGRDFLYRKLLPQALFIFAESEAGKQELIQYLGISSKKIKVVPLFAGNLIRVEEVKQKEILSQLNLQLHKYFFYPAQFWAHKNHYNLLLAFEKVSQFNPDIKLVFTGSDKGNLQYIKQLVNDLQLQEKVSFLGFVSDETLFTLYSNALALVMPSFLGPTNMPLLEAQELHCPVICSNHEGHKEMLQEAALYFSPDNAEEITAQMLKVIDPSIREYLLNKGLQLKERSIFTVNESINRIEQSFLDLISIRKTWS